MKGPVGLELSRRDFLRDTSLLGAAALIASAMPVADRILAANPAYAAVSTDDATMQAFADTIIPGRKAEKTDLGDEIHPDAIAGVDDEPGAVEADVLRLYHHPLTGFDVARARLPRRPEHALASAGRPVPRPRLRRAHRGPAAGAVVRQP